MSGVKKLQYHELKKFCDSGALGFGTTASLSSPKNIIGQSRAVAAFNFGLGTRRKGYNIYVAGVAGSGKTTFAKHFAEVAALNDPTPRDLCYVYNFKDAKHPKLLRLSPGCAAAFKEDLEETLDMLLVEVPKAFESKDFEEQRSDIVKKYEKKRDEDLKAFSAEAKTMGFEVRYTEKGMSFLPIVEGETLSIEDFEKLAAETKEKITENSNALQPKAEKIMSQVRLHDVEARKAIEELEYNVSLFTVGHVVAKLQEKYTDEQDALEYLKLLKEDILENIGNFNPEQEPDETENLQQLLPWISKKVKDDVLNKYKVNIIADSGSLATR